jgi:hypothetical protein
MRRYLVTTGIAAFMLMGAPATGGSTPDREDAVKSAPVAVQNLRVESPHLRDEVAMVLIGTVLIGLAAAVRRAA